MDLAFKVKNGKVIFSKNDEVFFSIPEDQIERFAILVQTARYVVRENNAEAKEAQEGKA